MNCIMCKHGVTRPGHVTVTLERDGGTLVMKQVPAQVGETCGEAYLDESITAQLLSAAEQAAKARVEVEVRAFVPA